MDKDGQPGVNFGQQRRSRLWPAAAHRTRTRPLELEMKSVTRILLMALFAVAPVAHAQAASLPVQVSVGANSATVRIGAVNTPLADLSIRFDDATGITAANLGIKAETISVNNPALLARLPSSLTSIPGALPLLITVEPPVSGTLVQHRVTHVEVHTHALPYVAGSSLRLFKAPLNGPFRDITESIQPGSVRTRGTTPGWSQFLVILDLRTSNSVIAEKFSYLQSQLNLLPASEAAPLQTYLNNAQVAVANGRYSDAVVAMDSFSERVSSRAGTNIPDVWRSARDVTNNAGELLAGANTLVFSIGYLRDFGH